MRKFHLWFSLLALITLGVSSYMSAGQGIFWLASGDMLSQYVRVGLAVFVIVQLFTEPPRHVAVRLLTSVAAAGAFGFAVYSLGQMTNPIYDTIIFLQTSIALAITALEMPLDDTVGDPQTT